MILQLYDEVLLKLIISANEALEKVASLGLVPNMIMYLMLEYHLGLAEGANILFYWLAATHFMPLFGAFLADSYLGRFLTIALGSIASLLVRTMFFFSSNFLMTFLFSI